MNNSTGGQIVVQDGGAISVGSAFANSSIITLNGPSATLAAGTISNTGSLLGIGTVSAAVANSGIIRPEPGQLTLSAAGNTNLAGGQIEAPAGSTVLFAQGLATNTGTIALNGGTFDNNHQPVLNTGSILGNGVFGSGGLTNASGGQINVADVATQFLGAVSNSGSIQITNNTTTFFDPFTNNAGGTLKTTAATVRFLSSVTNNGIFSSDPADNYFTDLTILATGVLEGGAGDRFFISGDFLNSSRGAKRMEHRPGPGRFAGRQAHVLGSRAGTLGANGAGYSDNFAIGTLVVDHGGAIVLHGPADSALYVGTLAAGGRAESDRLNPGRRPEDLLRPWPTGQRLSQRRDLRAGRGRDAGAGSRAVGRRRHSRSSFDFAPAAPRASRRPACLVEYKPCVKALPAQTTPSALPTSPSRCSVSIAGKSTIAIS